MARYGMPYKGSKNAIAEEILSFLPSGKRLVDLFGGGGAITDCAMRSYKWDGFLYNELNPLIFKAFKMAVNGEFKDVKRWISREDFKALKDTDPYVAICFSFSNNYVSYAYAQEIEPWKKALHYARVFKDTSLLKEMGIDSDGSRGDIKSHKGEYKKKYIKWWLSKQKYSEEELDALIEKCKGEIKKSEEKLRGYLCDALKKSGLTQSEVQNRLGTQMAGHYFGRSQWSFPTQEYYEMMQTFMPLDKDYNEIYDLHQLWKSLERLQSLQSLERLQSLELTNDTYLSYKHREGDVVYCDPPYEGTDCGGYSGFDHKAFYDWVATRPYQVFFSSYEISDNRFHRIWERRKNVLSSGNGAGNKKTECLYTNEPYIYSSLLGTQLEFEFEEGTDE